MRVILLGRKPVACSALRYMLSKGAEVVAVVTPGKDEPDPYPERLVDVADSFGIPVFQEKLLYDCLAGAQDALEIDLRNIDLIISILHQKRIRPPLIELGRIGCVNFHPAPLPEYSGWGTYNLAILEDVKQWGAAAHFVDEDFDTGPIIRVRYFDVDASKETALSLQLKTQPVLFELFKEVFQMALRDGFLPCTPQSQGRSITKKEIMAQRFITPHDTPQMVERKIRAFWYPPNPGAQIEVAGAHYILINKAIFDDIVPMVCNQSWRGDDLSTTVDEGAGS